MRTNVQVCDFSAIIIMVLDTCVSLVMPVMMALNDYFFLRFSKDDIPRLASALNLPDKYVCKQGTAATGIEALMIMLRRLYHTQTDSAIL